MSKELVKSGKSFLSSEEEMKDLTGLTVAAGNEEHLSQDELEMPFLRLGQKMTKVEIDDLKPGMFFNTVSEEVYGETLVIQVHGYFHNYTKWMGPKGNGEFRGSMTTSEFREFEKTASPALAKEGGDMVHTVEGEALRYTDTHNFLVSLPEYPEEGLMLYPLSSTGCKVAKKWNTLNNGRKINGQQAKRYATIWELTTGSFESNGFSYKQVKSLKSLGTPSKELLAFGEECSIFAQSVKEQGVKYSDEHTTTAADESEY